MITCVFLFMLAHMCVLVQNCTEYKKKHKRKCRCVCCCVFNDSERERHVNMYEEIITCLCLFVCAHVCMPWTWMHEARKKYKHMHKCRCVCMSVCFVILSERDIYQIVQINYYICVPVHVCMYVPASDRNVQSQNKKGSHEPKCMYVWMSIYLCYSEWEKHM